MRLIRPSSRLQAPTTVTDTGNDEDRYGMGARSRGGEGNKGVMLVGEGGERCSKSHMFRTHFAPPVTEFGSWFTGIFTATGVPLFGLALGQVGS